MTLTSCEIPNVRQFLVVYLVHAQERLLSVLVQVRQSGGASTWHSRMSPMSPLALERVSSTDVSSDLPPFGGTAWLRDQASGVHTHGVSQAACFFYFRHEQVEMS